MFDFMNKSVKLTANQRKYAKHILSVGQDLLDQAADDDETPLEITFWEALEVGGKYLGIGGN